MDHKWIEHDNKFNLFIKLISLVMYDILYLTTFKKPIVVEVDFS